MYVGTLPELPGAAALVLLGFCVGLAGSFFGIGGAFLVTPALNILGFPMAYAIGTDLAHMTGKSLVATIRHRRLGHVDPVAAGLLLIGSLPGVQLGALSVMRLERLGSTEPVLRVTYVILLAIIGGALARESWLGRARPGEYRARAPLQRWLQIPPAVPLRVSGIESVSAWGVVALGAATGFLAGFLGVGGGFIRMPAMLYLLGMPTRVAVGTDLVEVLFSGAYGTFLYALEGRVDVLAALTMLVGASVGSHLGALATRVVDQETIRGYLAITVLGSAAAVALRQAGLKRPSAVLLLVLAVSVAGLILYQLAQGIRSGRQVEGAGARHGGGG